MKQTKLSVVSFNLSSMDYDRSTNSPSLTLSQYYMRWNLSLTWGISVISLVFSIIYQQSWHSLNRLLVKVTLNKNNPSILSRTLLSGCTLYCVSKSRWAIQSIKKLFQLLFTLFGFWKLTIYLRFSRKVHNISDRKH